MVNRLAVSAYIFEGTTRTKSSNKTNVKETKKPDNKKGCVQVFCPEQYPILSCDDDCSNFGWLEERLVTERASLIKRHHIWFSVGDRNGAKVCLS